MRYTGFITIISLLLLLGAGISLADDNIFVGSETCKDCHEEQYETFMKYSKKAHSFKSIKKMEKKLTPEEYKGCFECHTTGYGKKGGFISEQETPDLRIAGCEVCHGPGSLHSESEDPDDIVRKMDMDVCITCHSQERISEFNFKPLLYGGAH